MFETGGEQLQKHGYAADKNPSYESIACEAVAGPSRTVDKRRGTTHCNRADRDEISNANTPKKTKKTKIMKKISTRFGEIEYNPDNLLHFPAGLIGFPDLHSFIVMPNKKNGPLFWMQSVEEPGLAFVLTDPTNFFLEYRVAPDSSEREKLHIDEKDEYFTLCVVSVPPDQKITFNLAAPILFSPKSNRAIQVILEDTEYSTKTPLPELPGKK